MTPHSVIDLASDTEHGRSHRVLTTATRLTRDDLVGSALAPMADASSFDDGAPIMGYSDADVAVWRTASPPTPTLDQAVKALRLAHELNKHVEYWSEAVRVALDSANDDTIKEALGSLPTEAAAITAWRRAHLSRVWFSERIDAARKYFADRVDVCLHDNWDADENPPVFFGVAWRRSTGVEAAIVLADASPPDDRNIGIVGMRKLYPIYDPGMNEIRVKFVPIADEVIGDRLRLWAMEEMVRHLADPCESAASILKPHERREGLRHARTLVSLARADGVERPATREVWDRVRFATYAHLFHKLCGSNGILPSPVVPSYDDVDSVIEASDSILAVRYAARDVHEVFQEMWHGTCGNNDVQLRRLICDPNTVTTGVLWQDGPNSHAHDARVRQDQVRLWMVIRHLFFPNGTQR